MNELTNAFGRFFLNIGLRNLQGGQFLMILIGLAVILLGVARRGRSLLIVALGFGLVVGNMPLSTQEWLWYDLSEGYGIFSFLNLLIAPNLLPVLVFLGLGAMTDFSPLIASPRLALLGAGAQVGIFAAVVLGTLLGLAPADSAVAASLGGAHGLLAIYAAAALSPERIGIAAIIAYGCALLAPAILGPITRLLTTPAERRIRMAPPRPVSRRVRILFPVFGFILCIMFVPAARGVLSMFFLGNLLRESGAADHISRTIGRSFTNVLTILLAFGVGQATSPQSFFTWSTLGVLVIGLLSFALAAGWGILMAKIMNLFLRRKINPLLGAAGVSVPPVAARIVHRLAADEDPDNHLLRQAMAPNLAATIALVLSIGIFVSMLG